MLPKLLLLICCVISISICRGDSEEEKRHEISDEDVEAVLQELIETTQNTNFKLKYEPVIVVGLGDSLLNQHMTARDYMIDKYERIIRDIRTIYSKDGETRDKIIKYIRNFIAAVQAAGDSIHDYWSVTNDFGRRFYNVFLRDLDKFRAECEKKCKAAKYKGDIEEKCERVSDLWKEKYKVCAFQFFEPLNQSYLEWAYLLEKHRSRLSRAVKRCRKKDLNKEQLVRWFKQLSSSGADEITQYAKDFIKFVQKNFDYGVRCITRVEIEADRYTVS